MGIQITAIILTYNEELHIDRCIRSVLPVADRIVVVDSYSTDSTVEIARSLGAEVFQNPFVNQAVQFNWSLQNCGIQTDWVVRIDADEYIEHFGSLNIRQYLEALPDEITGLYIRRKIVFMGRALLHGGWYPKWNLRIFRYGFGISENRWMDEHIVLSSGKSVQMELDFVDDNLNNLSWWTTKHNNYSGREVVDYFRDQVELDPEESVEPRFWGSDAERKRWLKIRYKKFPLFVRPFLNFLYRYIFLLGFLDGKQGLIWHFLQGFWYRFLVDAKIDEVKRACGNDVEKIKAYIYRNYNIKI